MKKKKNNNKIHIIPKKNTLDEDISPFYSDNDLISKTKFEHKEKNKKTKESVSSLVIKRESKAKKSNIKRKNLHQKDMKGNLK